MGDLITLDEYKDSLGLTSPKDDARYSSLITASSAMVKTYCAATFIDYYSIDKVEYFNIDFQTNIIQLLEAPIQVITSVEERSSYGSPYELLDAGEFEYYLDPNTDSLLRTKSTGYRDWAMGPGAVKVVYTGGYATAPEDLKLAVIDLVKYYFKEEYKERRSLGSGSIENKTTSTQARNVDFPDHIKRVLDLYKQIRV